jgi:hypothetical protein
MSKPKPSVLQHLTAVFGAHAHVEQLETALRTAAEHHNELAAHLHTRRDAGHFDGPDPLITRDGARMLADDHDRRAITYTALADLIRAALDGEDPR